MKAYQKRQEEQLGMSIGAARHRLRGMIVENFLKATGQNKCFRCGLVFKDGDSITIDHKISWTDRSPELFWDLDNIAWSHHACNARAGRRPASVGPNSFKGKSEHHGVYYEGSRPGPKKWTANQKVGGKKKRVGRFDTEAEAIAALEKAGGWRPKEDEGDDND